MDAKDFFIQQRVPADVFLPERMRTALNVSLVQQLRRAPVDGVDDMEAGRALTNLVYDDLYAFGTGGGEKLDNDEMALALRTLRLLIGRLGIKLELPFRDLGSFHTYWVRHGMKNSYAARRDYLDSVFEPILSRLDSLEDRQLVGAFRGVDGELKNIIFASTKYKPRIVLQDAINNVIEVAENAQYCLFYDRPINDSGLTWADLVDWWSAKPECEGGDNLEIARHLYKRLASSCDTGISEPSDNAPEHTLFKFYCERYGREGGDKQPAILPQVYLHYNPQTKSERGDKPGVLTRERMDFLLLLPHGVRIILEIDGKQHYAQGDQASPRAYASMVAEDRKLRLKGYEVYRFGGYELMQPDAGQMLREFFDKLLGSHGF